jgi:hypothetical protein
MVLKNKYAKCFIKTIIFTQVFNFEINFLLEGIQSYK